MKLNFDYVRDILIDCEENLGLKTHLQMSTDLETALVPEEKIYAALKLHEAGFIDARVVKYTDGGITMIIKSITWDGHQFLDNIRPQTAWEKTKGIAAKIGGGSITLLSEIAPKVVAELINAQL